MTIRVQNAPTTSNCDGCDKRTQCVKIAASCTGSSRVIHLCRKCEKELRTALDRCA